MNAARCLSLIAFVGLFAPARTVGAADATPSPIMIGGHYEITTVRDIPYVEGPEADASKHKLDLYLPKGKTDFPVVLFVHGGAWRSGDRKLYGGVGRVFAKNGIGAVIVSYRLSPQVLHPGHIEDVARAFAWTVKHIAEHGGRPDQVFITGQSAGGHLSALLATNESYLKAVGLSLKDIKGAMPMSGIYIVPPGRLESVMGKGAEAADSASPLKHVSGREPPFLILYADNDFPGCGAMSEALTRALKGKNVPAECISVKDRNHISIMFRMMTSEADPVSQALLAFVAKHAGLTLTPRDAEAKAAAPARPKDGAAASPPATSGGK